MSHAEIKEVVYLNGHRIKVGGLFYLMERTCRDTSNESPHASDFVCSSCGFAYSMSDDMSMLPDEIKYCPNCGARVVDE